jgi:hypothetical protein
MPRETVEIAVFGAPPASAMATLMAFIAYPEDKTRRLAFERCLYRLAILWRAETDPTWATGTQQLRPTAFIDDDAALLTFLKSGSKVLGRHLITATIFLTPHMIGVRKESEPLTLDKLHPRLEGVDAWCAPTVENMAIVVSALLGNKVPTSSYVNIKTREWSRVKPVVHLAYTLAEWMGIQSLTDSHKPPNTRFFEMFFDQAPLICITMGEQCRQKLPLVKQFSIKEDDTIQFVAAPGRTPRRESE